MILRQDFYDLASDILNSDYISKLNKLKHHKNTSRLEHSVGVANACFKFAKKFNLKVDLKSMVRGALLHDFFLYDLKKERINKHLTKHPEIALNNAVREYNINKIEKDIILKHMWPMTFKLPKYKESFIVCFVDTYCAIKECLLNN